MNFIIRTINDDDEDFIYATFLKSYKSDSIEGRRTYNHIYYPNFHDIVENLLDKSITHIACWDKDPQVIAGYLIYEKKESQLFLHYAFVKPKFRRIGVLRDLLQSAGFNKEDRPYFSFWTTSMDELIRHFPGWIYNPFVAR